MSTISIQRASRARQIPSDMLLRRWVRAALIAASAPAGAGLSLRLTGPAEARRLNARYRHRDYATNVLSFPCDLPPAGADIKAPRWLGDIVICAAVVARESREQGKMPAAHWAHMVVHGCLHLLGHDHLKAREAARMEALETQILARLGFPDPYLDF